MAATKKVMGFDLKKHFAVDVDVYSHMSLRERGAELQTEWETRFNGLGRPPSGDGRGLEAGLGRRAGARLAGRAANPLRPASHWPPRRRTAGDGRLLPYAPTMIGGAADLVEADQDEIFEGRDVLPHPQRPQRAVRDP